ncbi:MAG: DUF1573 domain-containing protein [Candidatus Hydrothermarchaeaceae archaeon]
MKGALILLALLVLLAGCVSTHESGHEDAAHDHETTSDAGPAGGPRISAPIEKHDFGMVPQYGGVVKHNFTIKNIGDEMLEIGTLTTSCACTSAVIDKKTIQSGGEAILTAIFDADVHAEPSERFSRIIFIESNDPATPELQLRIFVDIDEGK